MRLLIFTADREYLEASLGFATLLAKDSESSITLLYTITDEVDRERAQEETSRALDRLVGYNVEAHIRHGEPIPALVAEVEHRDIDLIIVGARRGIGFIQRAIRSLSQQVVEGAGIPVLVVRRPRDQIKRMLICTGGSKHAEDVIRTGASLAAALNVPANVLHVSTSVPSMYTGLGEMEETLQELLDTDTPLARHMRRSAELVLEEGAEGELELRHGVPADEILRRATEGDFDILVMGASGASDGMMGWLLGDVTQEVIHNSPCPVLIVK